MNQPTEPTFWERLGLREGRQRSLWLVASSAGFSALVLTAFAATRSSASALGTCVPAASETCCRGQTARCASRAQALRDAGEQVSTGDAGVLTFAGATRTNGTDVRASDVTRHGGSAEADDVMPGAAKANLVMPSIITRYSNKVRRHASFKVATVLLDKRGLSAAATGVAQSGHGKRSVISSYFAKGELRAAHPKPRGVRQLYHGFEHTREVAQISGILAKAFRLPREDALFREQVAVAHDLHDRVPGLPPRVAATIKAMREDYAGVRSLTGQGSSVLNRFGWSERKLRVGEAMVQRTDRLDAPNPDYGGRTGADVYEEMLSAMSPEEQDFALLHGAILSEYCDRMSVSLHHVPDLALMRVGALGAEELTRAGAPVKFEQTTASFLRALGTDEAFAIDESIARKHGRPVPKIPRRDEVLALLPREYRRNFENNLTFFRRFESPAPSAAY